MTVSYGGVNDNFVKLLLRWRGSIWKSLLPDLLAYLFLYYCISFTYRFALNAHQREIFEKVAVVCRDYTKNIPLTFVLGFYVGIVVKRWWEQFTYIPWPDNVMFWVSAYIHGDDEESRSIRRKVARYLILSATLALRGLSVRVYRRFPTLDHVEVAGLMTKAERKVFESIDIKFQPHGQWFLPLNWALSIFSHRAHVEKLLSYTELKMLIKGIEYYRSGYEKIFVYDWLTVPLVYTQVATVATYGFFVLCLLGSQYLTPSKPYHGYEIDLYVPFFTVLQFLFYVGWLKLNYLLDRHAEMAFLIADIHGQLPKSELSLFDTPGYKFAGFPHTRASAKCLDKPPRCHLRSVRMTRDDQLYVVGKTAGHEESDTKISGVVDMQKAKLIDVNCQPETTRSPIIY